MLFADLDSWPNAGAAAGLKPALEQALLSRRLRPASADDLCAMARASELLAAGRGG